jgi:hypothetical protein
MMGTITATAEDPARQASLDAHAEAMRGLGRHVVRDVVEIGERLAQAKELCSHGEWLTWLRDEFEWTDRHARNLINTYELSLKSENISDLNIPVAGLYLLAAPSTPVQAQQAVIAAAESGEKVTVAKVKEAIAEARDDGPPPRPRHRPPAEIITPNISAQLVALARKHLDAIVDLKRKMPQPERVRFRQEAMERLGGD